MKTWSSLLSLSMVCLLFASQAIFGAEETSTEPPPRLGEQPIVQETDTAGVTRSLGYLSVIYFDYWSDDALFDDKYEASGLSHGIVYSEQHPNGKGWSFAYSYAPGINLSGQGSTDVGMVDWRQSSWNEDYWYSYLKTDGYVDMNMVRHDADLGIHSEASGGVRGPLGWKLSFIDKEIFLDNVFLMNQETFYTGPYLGLSGNHPLGGKDSPLSFFWTGQMMALYISKEGSDWRGRSTISVSDAEDLGLGLNGTIGLALKLWEHGYIQAGYRGQLLGALEKEIMDCYQAWLVQVGLRF